MMSTASSRFPFTASQWQELEHQALIFKYMVSGMPIPPDLLYTIRRSSDSSLSTKLLLHQPQHIGWNCFQMGFGRRIDPEPGRCRRTDGKKWRCSKEAYPDSKYCERHMHRGRNRSRKPVEVMTTPSSANTSTTRPPAAIPISSITKNSSSSPSSPTSHTLSRLTSLASDPHHHMHSHPTYTTPLHHHFLYPHSSSSRPPGGDLSSQENTTTNFLLDSGAYSHVGKGYSYGQGGKRVVDEHAFFSETSGTMRSMSDSSQADSWQLAPLTMGSPLSHLKQRSYSGSQCGNSCYLQLQSSNDTPSRRQYYYSLGYDDKDDKHLTIDRDHDQPKKVMHHFFDEWPPKERDSWLDTDDKLASHAPVSKVQLSISMPNSSHD